MLTFKHVFMAALALSLAAPIAAAKDKKKAPTLASKEGKNVYVKKDEDDGFLRTVTINASKCERRSAALYKPPSCALSLYCYVKVHTEKHSKVAAGIVMEHDLEISNVVVTANCPLKKTESECPADTDKCIDDAATELADVPALVSETEQAQKKRDASKQKAE